MEDHQIAPTHKKTREIPLGSFCTIIPYCATSIAKRAERDLQHLRRHDKRMERILISSPTLDLAQIIRRDAKLLCQLHLRISFQATIISNITSDPTILLTCAHFNCLFCVCLQILHLPIQCHLRGVRCAQGAPYIPSFIFRSCNERPRSTATAYGFHRHIL